MSGQNERNGNNTMLQQSKDIIDEVRKVVIGKDDVIAKILMVILAKGHILIEDIPGVGKTTLALAFSKALSLDYKRIQFTPDVMPSDVTGFNLYNKKTGQFEFRPGAAMCNLFLADEINRTSSKTQSALLEVMEEGQITVDGVTHETPKPYTVIATQNPMGSAGTQMLPDSQLDRFMIRLKMGYPDRQSEINILKGRHASDPMETIQKAVSVSDLLLMQDTVSQIFVSDLIFQYVTSLICATRSHPMIQLGVSPRGTLAVVKMAKACAFLFGRNYVIPEDVQQVFCDVCEHRILLQPQAKMDDMNARSILDKLLLETSIPQ